MTTSTDPQATVATAAQDMAKAATITPPAEAVTQATTTRLVNKASARPAVIPTQAVVVNPVDTAMTPRPE